MCGDYYLRTIDLWIMGPMRFLCATMIICAPYKRTVRPSP
jgi:hypothetical protein